MYTVALAGSALLILPTSAVDDFCAFGGVSIAARSSSRRRCAVKVRIFGPFRDPSISGVYGFTVDGMEYAGEL